MNKKTYRTAQGVSVDIDQLRLLNEGVIAVGNMKVNARGDEVNNDGSVAQNRNDIMRNNYRINVPLVGGSSNTSKPTTTEPKSRASKVTADPKDTPVVEKPTQLRGSLASAVATPTTAKAPTDASADSTSTDVFGSASVSQTKSTIKRI